MRMLTLATAVATFLLVVGGCRDRAETTASKPAAPAAAAPPPSNRIDLPATVRQNLGITFAKVERRAVASTLRVPGRFELLPSARREYRTSLPGWVHLSAAQYDEIGEGMRLFSLDSPDWQKLRRELHESQAAIEAAAAELAVAEQTKIETEKAVQLLEKRVASLAGVQGPRVELEAELAARRNSIPRLDAETGVKRAALNEARHDFSLQVDTAAATLGVASGSLAEPAAGPGTHGHGEGEREQKVQRWFGISRIDRPARAAGVVEAVHVTDGAWVEANTLVLTVIDPRAVRFRATGLQSDLGRLRDGLAASIVPPQGSAIGRAEVLPGKLKVGLAGDPERRTIELLVAPEELAPWARPGVSALLEVVAEGSDGEALAVPASAVVRDDLTHVFFRRDPRNPDKVIRVEADMGVTDGTWVVINSGLKEGDEVVLDGVYELKLAGGGKAAGGGHFHADGTWHAEPDK